MNADPAAKAQSAELAKLLAAGMKGRGDAELSALLAHADRRARLDAQLELASRGDQSIAVFTKVANNRKAAPLARLVNPVPRSVLREHPALQRSFCRTTARHPCRSAASP